MFFETQPGLFLRQQYKGDPIFYDIRQGWGFYDETWCEEVGSWPSCKEAETELLFYEKYFLHINEEYTP